MNQTTVVSIITPTYNHEKYIRECIESVKAQSFIQWEQIIIDDGSTDGTYEEAKAAIGDDPRFTLIRQENKGIFRLDETYNKALELSKGEYIAILEGDDYWEPEKLDLQVNEFDKDSSVVLVWGRANGRILDLKQNYSVYPDLNHGIQIHELNNKPNGVFFNIVTNNYCPPLTYLTRKSALKKIGGFKQVLPFPAIDLNTVLDLSLIGNFKFINTTLGTWRISPNQTTKNRGLEIFEGSQKIIIDFLNGMSVSRKKQLDISEENVLNSFKKRHVITYSRLGRISLLNRDFNTARKYYIISITKYWFLEPMWKLRSIIGFVVSLFGLDVEFLAKYFGKGSFK